MATATCTKCRRSQDIVEFRWDNTKEGHCRKRARFDQALLGDNVPVSEDRTKTCRTCRSRHTSSDTPSARRRKECDEWYRSQLTLCTECHETRPECLGLIQVNPGEDVTPLSRIAHWATSDRGVEAMRRNRPLFRVLCFFCKSVSWQQNGDFVTTVFDEWLDDRLLVDECATCSRHATRETLRGFQFAHNDSALKTVHPVIGPVSMMTLRKSVRDGTLTSEEATRLAVNEWSLGRVLCHNCHRVETSSRNGR